MCTCAVSVCATHGSRHLPHLVRTHSPISSVLPLRSLPCHFQFLAQYPHNDCFIITNTHTAPKHNRRSCSCSRTILERSPSSPRRTHSQPSTHCLRHATASPSKRAAQAAVAVVAAATAALVEVLQRHPRRPGRRRWERRLPLRPVRSAISVRFDFISFGAETMATMETRCRMVYCMAQGT